MWKASQWGNRWGLSVVFQFNKGDSVSVADPGFLRGRGANSNGGCEKLLFGQLFPENCMKLKEFGPPEPYLYQRLAWIIEGSVRNHVTNVFNFRINFRNEFADWVKRCKTKFSHYLAFQISLKKRVVHLTRTMCYILKVILLLHFHVIKSDNKWKK